MKDAVGPSGPAAAWLTSPAIRARAVWGLLLFCHLGDRKQILSAAFETRISATRTEAL